MTCWTLRYDRTRNTDTCKLKKLQWRWIWYTSTGTPLLKNTTLITAIPLADRSTHRVLRPSLTADILVSSSAASTFSASEMSPSAPLPRELFGVAPSLVSARMRVPRFLDVGPSGVLSPSLRRLFCFTGFLGNGEGMSVTCSGVQPKFMSINSQHFLEEFVSCVTRKGIFVKYSHILQKTICHSKVMQKSFSITTHLNSCLSLSVHYILKERNKTT